MKLGVHIEAKILLEMVILGFLEAQMWGLVTNFPTATRLWSEEKALFPCQGT